MIIEQVKKIADLEGVTLAEMERKIGASQSTLNKAYSGKKDIQAKWLTVIIQIYPQYSAHWLLTGIPPIYKEDKTPSHTEVSGGNYIIANGHNNSVLAPTPTAKEKSSQSSSVGFWEQILLAKEEQISSLSEALKNAHATILALSSSIVNGK